MSSKPRVFMWDLSTCRKHAQEILPLQLLVLLTLPGAPLHKAVHCHPRPLSTYTLDEAVPEQQIATLSVREAGPLCILDFEKQADPT